MTQFNLPKMKHFNLPRTTNLKLPKIEVLQYLENDIFQSPRMTQFNLPKMEHFNLPKIVRLNSSVEFPKKMFYNEFTSYKTKQNEIRILTPTYR